MGREPGHFFPRRCRENKPCKRHISGKAVEVSCSCIDRPKGRGSSTVHRNLTEAGLTESQNPRRGRQYSKPLYAGLYHELEGLTSAVLEMVAPKY